MSLIKKLQEENAALREANIRLKTDLDRKINVATRLLVQRNTERFTLNKIQNELRDFLRNHGCGTSGRTPVIEMLSAMKGVLEIIEKKSDKIKKENISLKNLVNSLNIKSSEVEKYKPATQPTKVRRKKRIGDFVIPANTYEGETGVNWNDYAALEAIITRRESSRE